jgi:two-component system, chemotaxis family, response regulator PixG
MIQTNVKPTDLSFKDLIIRLKDIKEKSFSGNLVVKVDSAPSWTFSFRLGRLGWVGGGIEPVNRWQRQLTLAQLKLPPEKLAEINNPQQTSLDSHTLAKLLSEESIDRAECAELVNRMTTECLFDVIQFSQHCGNRLYYQMQPTGADNSQLNLILPLVEIEPILTKSIQTWQEWSNAGLAAYAPSLFPVVSKSEQAAQLIPDAGLRQVVFSIDGSRTLRSLAINYRQPVVNFATALLPLLRAGFITLSPQAKARPNRGVEREPSGQLAGVPAKSGTGNLPAKQRPLIACIDDSILIFQALEKVLLDNNYRCYGVQDPLKIMPSLIRNKPDFIFLDLLMPITNGYEVCEQIRKTPSLKDIPVIILTGKDGLVDRMRSKIVGATGFLGKPVNAESVLKMLEKYLVVGN